ncbi:hypothetical protein LTS07_000276 [Exophiala sideris]|nr:hypothetical protein LTS07_000276 [Exophiala sideris]
MAGTAEIEYREVRLSSCRVIDLLPGDYLAPIQCRIRHIDLEDPPSYEAISYVCGDPSNRVSITCDDSRIDIYRNLFNALRRFRLTDTHRRLWADCICINQRDSEEKSRQVLLMGDIYSKASKLGDESEDEDTDIAVQCINLISQQIWPRLKELEEFENKSITYRLNDQQEWAEDSKKGYHFNEPGPRNVEEITAAFGIPLPESREIANMGRFWKRAWFHRAWTFQESHLARERIFFCGRWEIPSLLLLRVLVSLRVLWKSTDDDRYLEPKELRILAMMKGRSSWSPQNQVNNTFLVTINLRRGSGCTLPSDFIYCLLRSTTECPAIIPDYTKPFWQVFTEATFHTVLGTKSFATLGCVDPEDGDSILPSWVPDWRRRKTHSSVTSLSKRKYNCSGSSEPVVKLCAEEKKLSVIGILWDHVDSTVTSRKNSKYMQELMMKVGEVYQPTQESLNDTWMRTACTDLTLYESEPTRWTANSAARVEELSRCDDELQAAAYTAFIRAMVKQNVDRVYIITQQGRLGTALEQARAGDVIAIALGSEVPFLLRACADGGYKFISECYIHGFMDGEALVDEWKRQKPDADHGDISWLENLHDLQSKGELPFETQEFILS